MSSASLAAKYRPQTFAEVVGQDMVKTVLSRAAQEDRVAPAYLLSGTRGVGKTTIARIFAKALNCVQAPGPEPCGLCDNCRRISQGSFVDVVEIDGASNRGIDDIRRLRDAVGYAPLEGRYKVFIIDEAHMLTKEAFNALLKTLEEPPARVCFILATTEQHKFPITIISRCQHFVFKQIAEPVLAEHLQSVLEREGASFEPEALELIARRAQGSVRDAMSLLDQTLALSSQTRLDAGQTRQVLGLAGREARSQLLEAIAAQNLPAIHALTRELLDQGIDIGFFLREFAGLWRNLFLLTQSKGQILPQLRLNAEEAAQITAQAALLSPAHIHAAWQMTMEALRKILTSLEPAAGLELLFYNLAMLPQLVPIKELRTDPDEATPTPIAQPALAEAQKKNPEPGLIEPGLSEPDLIASEPPPASLTEPQSASDPLEPHQNAGPPVADDGPKLDPPADFLDYCRANCRFGYLLQQCSWQRLENQLEIRTNSATQLQQLQTEKATLTALAADWAGQTLQIELLPPAEERLTEGEIKEKLAGHPTIKALEELYGAKFA